jgi:anthranilate phosphoribosyltransferase
MKIFIEKLLSGTDLTGPEIEQAFDKIMSGKTDDIQIAAFLVALRAKGEKPSEIASAAKVMRAKALHVETGLDVVDTCGTGGDGSATFNISTAVAFVLAGAGYKVAKHGNRSVSSSSGSADCLEALGVPIDLGPEDAADAIKNKGFAFLFAPKYHPSMKYAMPARKQLGIRTIFNILGPLSNPANASFQVLGVYSKDLIEPMAQTLKILGLKGAMIVHSGLDEVSISSPTIYARLKNGEIISGEIKPEDAGITPASIDSIKVSSPAQSAEIIEAVFAGKLAGPHRDVIALNAAAGFMALDANINIKEGVKKALDVIGSGAAKQALDRVKQI